jgi:hypothetical protein
MWLAPPKGEIAPSIEINTDFSLSTLNRVSTVWQSLTAMHWTLCPVLRGSASISQLTAFERKSHA